MWVKQRKYNLKMKGSKLFNMERVSKLGLMEVVMKANGLMVYKKATVYKSGLNRT